MDILYIALVAILCDVVIPITWLWLLGLLPIGTTADEPWRRAWRWLRGA